MTTTIGFWVAMKLAFGAGLGLVFAGLIGLLIFSFLAMVLDG